MSSVRLCSLMSRRLWRNIPTSHRQPYSQRLCCWAKGPLLFPGSHCQAWVTISLKALHKCRWLLVPARASGRFSPHEPLPALDTRAQVTLENFISLPRVKDSLSCCRLGLELSASGPGRRNHAVHASAPQRTPDKSLASPSARLVTSYDFIYSQH